IEKRLPITDRIERITGRAEKWLALQQKSNQEKRIAIIYYNSHGGKGDISASYLNVEKSLEELLKALKEDGYDIGDKQASENLFEQILEKGLNVGSWAPGAFEELVEAGTLTVDKEEYLNWYQELDEGLRQEVEAEWGPPPGEIMVHDDQIVIPGLMLGNVFIGPQPRRAIGDDPDKLTHSATLPPTHQYLAFYFWLQKGWESDAVIHMGTHGSLEFTPGRAVGLGGDDWPDILIGDLPNIYPYIMDNVAEAMIAKRRGYAVTISHQTPPLISAMYGELVELEQWVEEYATTATDAARREALEKVIREQVLAMGLDKILKLDVSQETIDAINNTLMDYFETLKKNQMPYGMHTLGIPPEGDVLQAMVDA
ncbi:MAG: cobaltochelatase subunit CobN, partial [Desulfitobacterium hafniense]